jgi:hypothetical protein
MYPSICPNFLRAQGHGRSCYYVSDNKSAMALIIQAVDFQILQDTLLSDIFGIMKIRDVTSSSSAVAIKTERAYFRIIIN